MRKRIRENAETNPSIRQSDAPISGTGEERRPAEGIDDSRRQVLHLGALAALALTGCGTASSGGNAGSQTGSTTGGQTGSTTGQTGSMTGGQTGSATGQTGSTTGGQTGSATGGQTGSTSGSQTGSTTGGQTGSTSGAQTGSTSGSHTGTSGSQTGSVSDGGGSGVSSGSSGTSSGSTSMGDGGMGWQEANCTPVTTLPAGTMGPSNKMCPNPFKFMNGSTISSKADWECLRADLSAMLQAAVYGPKMPPPDTLTATMGSGGVVTVNCKVGTKTGSFSFTIAGANTSKPGPAVIRIASSGNPFPSSVATIDVPQTGLLHQFADENKMWPTTGLVTTLYGNTAAKSGSDICWAWGASRIIDALVQLGPAATGINPKQLAVTGCSFAGKGAFACGAFDERFVLVAPEEAGSGGAALWRVSSAEAALGQNIQEATEIVGEQNWQGKDFHDLFAGKSKTNAPVDMLIADQHFLVALCAPRACLIIDNDIDWLGPLATYAGGVIGKKVYTALGIPERCEVNVSSEHSHCAFPSSQQGELTTFINRYLLQTTMTAPAAMDVLNDTHSTIKTYTESQWVDWTAPTLSGSLSWDPFA